MNIAEAKQALMDIADGDYHHLEYKVTDNGKGEASQECKVYTHKLGSFSATHWETALRELKESANGKPAINEDMPVSKAQ